LDTFSRRHGYKPVREQLQFESMDDDLRNSLWNLLLGYFFDKDKVMVKDNRYFPSYIKILVEDIYDNFLKYPIDKMSFDWYIERKIIRKEFFNWKWYEVYDFIEFIMNSDFEEKLEWKHKYKIWAIRNKQKFISNLMIILKREAAAYAVLKANDKYYISPITNDAEIDTIESAIKDTSELEIKQVGVHLQEALVKFSDRTNPDYRNSIKESISAVEALCRTITKKKKASLGDCLKEIENRIKLHPALKESFIKLYGYTSDADGIRHSLMDESNLDLEDAMFMLVACSVFINYLLVKADKAGISLK